MSKITSIKYHNGRWSWSIDGVAYATNFKGNGIFKEDENGFFSDQIAGTCDFKACESVSKMRRKLKAWFPDLDD